MGPYIVPRAPLWPKDGWGEEDGSVPGGEAYYWGFVSVLFSFCLFLVLVLLRLVFSVFFLFALCG